MEFRISDTFTGSLAKLTGQEQKLVKTTVFDLQTNPLNPGLRLHKLDNARDPNFWSASVSMDMVSGSAGTGKTIVALHRAVFLAKKYPDARILLTTFSEPLANALRNKLKILLKHSPRIGERLEVYPIDELGLRLYNLNIGKCKIPSDNCIRELIQNAAQENPECHFTTHFLFSEWVQVVDAWRWGRTRLILLLNQVVCGINRQFLTD